jgi:DNA-binding XRE family transcriptional regulator
MTNLKLLRMQRGISQRDIAKQLGISEITMSRIECGWFARAPRGIEAKLQDYFPGWNWELLMREAPTPQPIGDQE